MVEVGYWGNQSLCRNIVEATKMIWVNNGLAGFYQGYSSMVSFPAEPYNPICIEHRFCLGLGS